MKATANTYGVVVVAKDETTFGRISSASETLSQVVTKYALVSGVSYKGILADLDGSNNVVFFEDTDGYYQVGATGAVSVTASGKGAEYNNLA